MKFLVSGQEKRSAAAQIIQGSWPNRLRFFHFAKPERFLIGKFAQRGAFLETVTLTELGTLLRAPAGQRLAEANGF